MKALALIAHDSKKELLLDFVQINAQLLAKFPLIATRTSGEMLKKQTGLQIEVVNSGPLGGDIQIAARVVAGEIAAVLFFRDPLGAQPHEPDIGALLRTCDLHNVPCVTNRNGSELLLRGLLTGIS